MSLFSIFGGGNAPAYPTDTIVAPDGTEVTFTFFKHASLSIRFGERYIYTDPVHQYNMPNTRACPRPIWCWSPIRITTIWTAPQ